MPFESLGPTLPIAATADTTGSNPGNYTTTFHASDLLTRKNYVIWHMVAENLPLGYQVAIKWNQTRTISGFGPFTGATREFWGRIPMRDGDELFFYWTIPVSVTTVPVVTIWTEYDPTLPANS